MKIMRRIYKSLTVVCALLSAVNITAQNVAVGKPLPMWSDGYLDIHAVNTARGECSFFILPDGTTLLVDVGEFKSDAPNLVPQKPNENVTPSEAVTRYITHFMNPMRNKEIDYMLLTHFHIDHMGEINKDYKWSDTKAYQLTGVTAVGERIPFKKVIDRGWPDYQYPEPPVSKAAPNYINFVKWHVDHNNLKAEQFKVGVNDQVVLTKKPEKYPTFEIRNIAANGYVWTGRESITRNYFIPSECFSKEEKPSENMCSIAFRLSYGKFDYFSGGDLPSVTNFEWQNLDRPVGFATGPVEACKSNHHMNFDTMGADLLKAIRPQVIVIHNCRAQQPDLEILRRVTSQKAYPGERHIFSTNLHPATKLVVYPTTEKIAASQGHIVIRVQPGGEEFYVYALDDSNEKYEVTSIHGPFKCN